jgi:sugar/nucleoside kinase (ribokinase family)
MPIVAVMRNPMTKKYNVVSVCNALVDILIKADDSDLKELNLTKGNMHLVEADAQKKLLEHFSSKEKVTELGGSSLNAIRSLAALNNKTFFAGMVSNDVFGEQIKSRMGELSIDHQLGESSEPTGSCVVLITPDGERTMHTHLGASRLYGPDQVPAAAIESAEIFHFCGYQWDTDDQKAAIIESIKLAKAAKTLISFDVADPFIVGLHKDAFAEVISNDADIVFANKEEAKLLYDLSPEETAAKIAASGAVAVVKLGADGALIQRGDQVVKVDVVKTDVVDTTAAGDMFAAGFLHGYSQDKSLEECGKMAATIASDVISRVGAKVSEDAFNKLRNM